MTIETSLVGVVGPLLSNRFYADYAPATATLPYGTYQQIGGETVEFVSDDDPGLYNARIQINVWAKTRQEANTLMRSIVAALRPAPLRGRPVGALIARLNEFNETRGAQQDIAFWHT